MEDARETPEEMASNFTCAMFETPQAVLKGARHMVRVDVFVGHTNKYKKFCCVVLDCQFRL